MAGATLILPFLPMLPVQILLNNLLYDVSEMPIALDEVDREITEKPEHWDMRFIRNFMLLLGPVSSVFDFLTFGLLLLVFHADEALFQTGWFIESLANQVLVIFVLRTRRNPLRSRPHPLLATTSVAVVVLAVLLPFTPLGAWFGFVPPSAGFLFAIAGLTVTYLLLAQVAKWAFYRQWSPAGAVPAPLIRAPLPLIGVAGEPPSITFEHNGRRIAWRPRLIVGADGRSSTVQRQLSFAVCHDEPHNLIGGMP